MWSLKTYFVYMYLLQLIMFNPCSADTSQYVFDVYYETRLSSFFDTQSAGSLLECCKVCVRNSSCASVLYSDTTETCELSLDGPELNVSASGWTVATRTPAGKPTSEVNKKAVQSSTYISTVYTLSSDIPADVAIDGNLDTDLETTRSCTATDGEVRPWWKAIFYDVVVVREVILLNRGDCCWERLRDIVVTVDGKVCGTFDGPGTQAQSVTLTCPTPLVGKEVKVQIESPDPGNLQLCEVTIS